MGVSFLDRISGDDLDGIFNEATSFAEKILETVTNYFEYIRQEFNRIAGGQEEAAQDNTRFWSDNPALPYEDTVVYGLKRFYLEPGVDKDLVAKLVRTSPGEQIAGEQAVITGFDGTPFPVDIMTLEQDVGMMTPVPLFGRVGPVDPAMFKNGNAVVLGRHPYNPAMLKIRFRKGKYADSDYYVRNIMAIDRQGSGSKPIFKIEGEISYPLRGRELEAGSGKYYIGQQDIDAYLANTPHTGSAPKRSSGSIPQGHSINI